jgi:hypothetical protein
MRLAYVVLVLFVPIAIVISRSMLRAPATSVVVIGGSLFLPELVALDLPGVPALDKEAVTYFSAFVGAAAASRLGSARQWVGPELPISLLIVCAIGVTVLTNPEPSASGGQLEPALGIQDFVSQSIDVLIYTWLPFFVGRMLIRSSADLRILLRTIVLGGLVCGALAAIEVLLSVPFRSFQFSCFLFDICPIPTERWGTIQPVVFMENSLSLAVFLVTATLAGAGLLRIRALPIGRGRSRWVQSFMLGAVILSKNIASIVYAFSLSAVVATLSTRRMIAIAALLSSFVMLYPFTRYAGLFPWEELVEIASAIDKERMISLYGRFWEEDFVLSQMGDHLWFGWGTIDRVPDAMSFKTIEVQGVTGGDEGIDPYWVIVMGMSGIVGLELRFALLLLPVILATRTVRRSSSPTNVLMATVAAIIAVRAIDLLPNGWWSNLPLFLAGALYRVSRERPAGRGRAGHSRRASESAEATTDAPSSFR